jgi:hypothetical protein
MLHKSLIFCMSWLADFTCVLRAVIVLSVSNCDLH